MQSSVDSSIWGSGSFESGSTDTEYETTNKTSSPDQFMVTQPGAKCRVVIVGAGLAGLAAAQRLWSAGIKDIMLLEAQDHIGGRVQTIKHSGGILELGAQYFHGADENPIYDWVNKMVKLSGFEDGTILMQGRYFTATGEQLSPSLVDQFLKLIMKIKIELFNRKTATPGDSDETRQVYISSAGQEFRKEFDELLANDAELAKNKAHLLSLFEWFLRSEAIENGCDLMDEVSMASYIGWTDFSDGATLDFHSGYKSLLDWFTTQFPVSQVVHLNCEVSNIELINHDHQSNMIMQQDDESHTAASESPSAGPVVVHFRKLIGDRQVDCSIECNHVLVTASMGYLKRHINSLFTPPLPKAKQELINTIGYGTVNKIFLQFEQPFWLQTSYDNNNEAEEKQVDGIKLVWEERDFEDGFFPEWARDISSFERVKRQDNVLVGWIGGRGAKLMERESDEVIGETCLRILKRFLCNSEPGKVIWCMATRWFSNPYTCGSYSFHSMKSQDKDIDQLHEPVYCKIEGDPDRHQPAILFAGEATAGELYSTTHGAILSGWREADQIIALSGP